MPTPCKEVRERWKPVVGYESSYSVSTYGRVRSEPRPIRGRWGLRLVDGQLLTPSPDVDGYLVVGLSELGTTRTMKVHRLVAEAFLPNPDGKPEVNHKDGRKANNGWENLEWATALENANHAKVNGLRPVGTDFASSKLTDAKVRLIRARLRQKHNQHTIASDFGVSQTLVSLIHRNKIWTHVQDYFAKPRTPKGEAGEKVRRRIEEVGARKAFAGKPLRRKDSDDD